MQATLGDVLYADQSRAARTEQDWARLVRAVAAQDQVALHALYDRAHRPVFTLLLRLTSNPAMAEELTLDVFHGVWRRASGYEPAKANTVLAWIMNQARARAIERLGNERRRKLKEPEHYALLPIEQPDYQDLLALKERGQALRNALKVLSAEERQALEDAYFHEISQDSARPLIRCALHKLRRTLALKNSMTAPLEVNDCEQGELVAAYVARALSEDDARGLEAHFGSCWQCRREVEALLPVVDAFVAWPTDVLRPRWDLRSSLAKRIADETNGAPLFPARRQWSEPQWEEVAPGISCKLLATDAERHMVSMLVRLVPGGEYPPHTHAGVEELHLLDGELWIEERKLHAGDYNRAEPGTGDKRVWSETGCACVLVTSTRDKLS
jgi:RNA polymerase sigma-70 factor (ECF subfamily)